jgi:hypothetical protein
MSLGKIINNMLDRILPDVVGDLVGCAVDVMTGNPQGAALNAFDAFEDVVEPFADGPIAQGLERATEWLDELAA